MLLIEDIRGVPKDFRGEPMDFHYFHRRSGDNARISAEDYLTRQGCTHILHSDDGVSYGIVERREVVQQRIMEPRHDG